MQWSHEHAALGAIPSRFQRRWPALCRHLPLCIRTYTAPTALGREMYARVPRTGTGIVWACQVRAQTQLPYGKGEGRSRERTWFWLCSVLVRAMLVPISGAGATRARESEAPRARHEQEGSWQQRGVSSQVNLLLILFYTVLLAGGNLMTPGRSTLCN